MVEKVLALVAGYFELCSEDFAAEGQLVAGTAERLPVRGGAGYNAASSEPALEIPVVYRRSALRSAG